MSESLGHAALCRMAWRKARSFWKLTAPCKLMLQAEISPKFALKFAAQLVQSSAHTAEWLDTVHTCFMISRIRQGLLCR